MSILSLLLVIVSHEAGGSPRELVVDRTSGEPRKETVGGGEGGRSIVLAWLRKNCMSSIRCFDISVRVSLRITVNSICVWRKSVWIESK